MSTTTTKETIMLAKETHELLVALAEFDDLSSIDSIVAKALKAFADKKKKDDFDVEKWYARWEERTAKGKSTTGKNSAVKAAAARV